MQRLISCDEVFDVLTRVPFPSGAAEDAEVELHLGGCHECRQLAEALRPAAGLLHESLEESCLPAYRGEIGERAIGEMGERFAIEPWLKPATPPPQNSIWFVQTARFAAALLLVGMLCISAGLIAKIRTPATVDSEQIRAQLVSYPLPALCLHALTQATGRDACCTGCHNAIETQPKAGIAALAISCQVCHADVDNP